MINTLLEHVPIKMEVKDVDDIEEQTLEDPKEKVTTKSEFEAEEDDEEDEEDEDEEEEDDEEEESDLETDALEIEQEATLLISSDEEAELEAQRIRFPDKILSKNKSRSNSRNSQCSSTSSVLSANSQMNALKVPSPSQDTDKKQRISPRLKATENNKEKESLNKENNTSNNNNNNTSYNITTTTNTINNKKKTEKENKKLENSNKTKQQQQQQLDSNNKSLLEPHKASEVINKHLENNRNLENLPKSPGSLTGPKSRRGSNNSTCSVASTVASDSAETESCGNIYVFNLQQKLIFNCEFCDLKYGDLENFARHLHEAHKLFNFDEDPEKENAPRNLRKKPQNNSQKTAANVKKEPLHSLDSIAEPPVALPLSVLAEPLNSCGNVFMLNHRKLFLICGYCECKYANLDLFEKHLRQQHRIFEGCRNEVNVIPKVEVKEEVYIITEVIPANQHIPTPQAMVAIPAEIPLDISINPDNQHLTEKALEEVEMAECSNDVNKEPANNLETENLKSNKDVEIVSCSNENLNLPEAMDVNKPVTPKKTRNKRRSSPVKPINSPNKRPKRNTRNKKKIEEKNSIPIVAEKIPEITIIPEAATPASPTDTKKLPENKKVSETKEVKLRKSIRSIELKKPITEESKESKENKKELKETKENKKAHTKTSETNTSKVSENTETVSSKVLANTETSDTNTTIITEEVKNAKTTDETKKQRRKSRVEEPKKQMTTKETTEKTKPTRKSLKSHEAKKTKETKVKETERENETEAEKETETEKKTETEKEVNETLKEAETLKEVETEKPTETGTKKSQLKGSKEKKLSSEQDKSYECDICQARFRRKQGLLMHKKVHKIDDINTPKSSSSLQNHIQKKHSGTKHFFTCGICQRDFSTKYSVLNHIAIEHYLMFEDEEDTVQDDELVNEEKDREGQITNDNNRQESEAKEKESLTTERITLEEQPLQMTDVVRENLSCGELDEDDLAADPVHDIVQQLQNEILENRQANAITFTINAVPDNLLLKIPNKSNTSPIIATDDSMEHQLNSPQDIKPTLLQIVKRYVCDQCPRSFEKHIRLVEHKRLHTGEKPYECDQCGKQFRIRMRLNEHKLRHSKEKKFKCEICELACCTKQDLNLHMRHHTNDRRFQCSMCPKAFVRSSDLKIHVRVHTGEKPYVCDICHKCFRANQNLSVHKKSHMGEASKTLQCEMCDKKFMRNIDRKVHMRSHTGEKPFKCEICQRGYSSKVNVRSHIERDHMSTTGKQETPIKTKRKTGPKPKALREELEKQKKLIEELQHQLMQQIKTDEKIIPCEEDIPLEDTLQDCNLTLTTNDPIQSAYELLNKLKTGNNSKPLTIIPSPPPLAEPPCFTTKGKTTSSSLLPLTITQKIEQHSPAPSCSISAAGSNTGSTTSLSCLSTPSPPQKNTATKVVSQKTTSLGIQQVSVTVSMQVENVATSASPQTPTTPEKENSGILTTSTQSTTASSQTQTTTTAASVKKERKITSYFTVVGQKGEV